MMESMWRRLSFLTALVDAAPNQRLGRDSTYEAAFFC